MPVPYRRTVDEAWRLLRSLRATPPGNASRGQAKTLFSAALEQSEQFFRAADAVGYETKPVMLYYGISQATQAILVALRDPKSQPRTPSSHGTDCPNRDQISEAGDLTVTAASTQAGGFQMLAVALDSPTLPGPTALRHLWISLPEGVLVPPSGTDDLFGAALLERRDGQEYWTPFADTAGRVATLAHLPFTLMPLDVAEVERTLIERYPALLGFHVIANSRHPETAHWVQLLQTHGLRATLTFHRNGRPTLYNDVRGMVNMGPTVYGNLPANTLWLPPTLPGNSTPLHPLMTWYATLFGLSELARYRPTTWANAININSSVDASALEYLMDSAHIACVNLMAELFVVRSPSGLDTPDGLLRYKDRVLAQLRAQQSTDAPSPG